MGYVVGLRSVTCSYHARVVPPTAVKVSEPDALAAKKKMMGSTTSRAVLSRMYNVVVEPRGESGRRGAATMPTAAVRTVLEKFFFLFGKCLARVKKFKITLRYAGS